MSAVGELVADLASGRTTSEELLEECLGRIQAQDGEGERAFIEVDPDGARKAARAIDALRQKGEPAFAWHRDLIAEREAEYDPRILERIRRGERHTAHELAALHEQRQAIIDRVRKRLEGYDAFVYPTVPIVAPPLDALEDADEYVRINLVLLRNPTVVNIVDGCAASVPIHEDGGPPAGLTVAALRNQDTQVLRIARWVEERV